ncbi:MAG: hypothetical protein ACE5D6_07975 [Candidatus Zixiibacteriota bacterium]
MFIRTRNISEFFVFIFILFFFVNITYADSLVTRDDFLCYDTTIGNPPDAFFHCTAIDGNGNISQVNAVDTIPSLGAFYYHQYNLFDKYGNQIQPVTNFLPDTINDTPFISAGYTANYVNSNGISFIPSYTRSPAPISEDFILGFLFDSDGKQLGETKCLSCDLPMQYVNWSWNAWGGINNNGNAIAAWVADFSYSNDDSVIVRLYYPETDSLSPIISPMSLPHNIIGAPDGYQIYRTETRAKVADDGSFAVAWNMGGSGFSHILYVVYNSDYTPRTEISICDCDSSLIDTTQCTGYRANFMSMAMESDGDFYIAWSVVQVSPYSDVSNHIWMRGYNSDGTPKYDRVRLNDSDSLRLSFWEEIRPYISCNDSGNVLVTWTDARDYTGNYDPKPRNLYAQKVDPEGNLVGYNYRINNINGSCKGISGVNSCDMNNAGQAIFSWQNYPYDYPRLASQLMPYDQVGRFIPGDFNYDLSADIADLITVVDYMFNNEINTFWPRNLIDVDSSGNVDIADLVYLVDYMFFNGPVPITPDEGIRPNPGKFDLGG